MIKLEKLYAATDRGLHIILRYYPQAREALDGKQKFKMREGERTPSATIRLYDTPDGQVYKVTDFGDEGRPLSPIDIVMREEGVRFPEAVLRMAAAFNVADELNRAVNKPRWEERPATPDEKEGDILFELLPEMTDEQLKILGPRVKAEHAKALHWYAAAWVGTVKDRKVKIEHATENYPIFIRECSVEAKGDEPARTFHKIYKPLNPEKGFRFLYAPRGGKPRQYINGFAEMKEQYRAYNAQAEEGETKKLPEVVICSGERDAICCKSMGYIPLWFNSETYQLSEEEMRDIQKYAKVVYNIPDLDETGRKKGCELALKFLDVRTVWLPAWLSTFKDHRGKARKDLRDWMELRQDKQDFRGLLELAQPAKFWRERASEKGKMEYSIDSVSLLNFLEINGFFTLDDKDSKEVRFVRISQNVVKQVQHRDVRRFIVEWSAANHLNSGVRNLILNTPRLAAPTLLENLTCKQLDFSTATPQSQFFYAQRKNGSYITLEVTREGVREVGDASSLGRFIWEEQIFPHHYAPLPPMFDVERGFDEEGRPTFALQVNDVSSPLFAYLVNSSRLYWREELEYRFEGRPRQEKLDYHAANKFRIDGEGLTPEQIAEQKQNLLSKIFTIGYMLHRYKSAARAWAPLALDNKIGESGQCNGRSGKSLLFKALTNALRTVTLSGRNPKLMENNHVFKQVAKDTEMVYVDDCNDRFPMSQFYDLITNDITINPKNNKSFTIPFKESPKFAFSSNYAPTEFNASTADRILYLVFSDYYHKRSSENDYLEDRSVMDDFGRELFGVSYPEEDWNADLNFLLQCCSFYLSLANESIKIQPPMRNIELRKSKSDMGENFEDWAYVYFSQESGNLDRIIPKAEAIDDYRMSVGGMGASITSHFFLKKLKAFADAAEHVFSCKPPEELTAGDGRIIRRLNGKTKECIYVRSTLAEQEGWPINNSYTSMFIKEEGGYPV